MFKLAVFDMDGTILDTVEDLTKSLNLALKKHNMPVRTVADVRRFLGNGIVRLTERALPPEHNTDAVLVNQIVEDLISFYQQYRVEKTKPYEGIQEMLDTLQANNIHLAILSNKMHLDTQEMATHYFGSQMELVYGLREGVPAKPDISSLVEIMKHFDVTPEETGYIGDSTVDVETGLSAGAFTIGVDWGFQGEEKLIGAGCEHIAYHPNDIVTFLVEQ